MNNRSPKTFCCLHNCDCLQNIISWWTSFGTPVIAQHVVPVLPRKCSLLLAYCFCTNFISPEAEAGSKMMEQSPDILQCNAASFSLGRCRGSSNQSPPVCVQIPQTESMFSLTACANAWDIWSKFKSCSLSQSIDRFLGWNLSQNPMGQHFHTRLTVLESKICDPNDSPDVVHICRCMLRSAMVPLIGARQTRAGGSSWSRRAADPRRRHRAVLAWSPRSADII